MQADREANREADRAATLAGVGACVVAKPDPRAEIWAQATLAPIPASVRGMPASAGVTRAADKMESRDAIPTYITRRGTTAITVALLKCSLVHACSPPSAAGCLTYLL